MLKMLSGQRKNSIKILKVPNEKIIYPCSQNIRIPVKGLPNPKSVFDN